MRYDGSSDVSSAFTGTLLTISQGDVTITNVTLDGNKENVTASGYLLYIDGSTTVVTLGDGATVRNNKKSSRGSGVYISAGTFKMTGGTVTGNEGTSGYGPGVYIDDNATFEMSGGIINRNDAYTSAYGGGGVYVRGTFTMSGGEISGNKAGNGGGVYVPSACEGFTMTGGKIINNTATNLGGGVYANGTFEMSDGEITGNTAPSGSGVYDTSSKFTHTGGTVQSD